MSTIDEINQLAFEHGQPAENGNGYLFSQEQFDAFAESVIATATPPAPIPSVIDERAEFENYYRDRIMGNRTGVRFLRSSSGAYLDREVVEMWSGWQASRAVLAQEAGKCEAVAELLVEFFEHGPMATINWFTPSAFEHGATKVYTSPPAPVSVAQNAKRYEWIRSQNVGHCEISRTLFETISDDCNPPYRSLKYGKDLDAAIDEHIDKVKELNQ